MRLGIEVLLSEKAHRVKLQGKRLALVGHPASVTSTLVHSLDALKDCTDLKLSAAFGPQHGMRGEKQDNMIESDDYRDPDTGLPVFSLYGAVRRPTDDMMASFDVLLFDLQDVGCRIYTYVTTLLYMLEACALHKKEIWVLDRPNPIGRPVEGRRLKRGWESFVGATEIPMRHGLTLGELARWMVKHHKLDVALKVVPMDGYNPLTAPGYGWPTGDVAWVNPSPNMPVLCTARTFPGTVLLEGTNLSEGRGTTRPLQLFGAPGIPAQKVLHEMARFEPRWLQGCRLRPAYFEPTFHKFTGQLCSGLQIHVDDNSYEHRLFKSHRLMLSFFKALRKVAPGILEWRQPPYEYEKSRLPVDLLNGGDVERKWVDDSNATSGDLEKLLRDEESSWIGEREEFLLYASDPR